MSKHFLPKIVFLLVVLLAVVGVIMAVVRSHFGPGTGAAQTESFFEQFITAGGPIVWFILLPMSLIMVYLAAEHSLTIRRKRLLPPGVGGRIIEIIERSGPAAIKAEAGGQKDFVSTAVAKAFAKGSGDWFRMRSSLIESLQEQAGELLRKIEWLSLIGNVSPMVGLFGTVFGMIKLFNAIVIAGGQPQPAQLAEGISTALVTTFWGLFIAIPALAIHGVFRNRIETLISDAMVEAENIMPEVKRSLKQQQTNKDQQTKESLPIREIRPSRTQTIRQTLP